MLKIENMTRIKLFLDKLRTLFIWSLIAASIYVAYNLSIETFTFQEFIKTFLVTGAVIAAVAFLLWMLYKFIIEYVECEFKRKRSSEVLTDNKKISISRQVSGPPGRGKDASTVGSAILIREKCIERDLEKMENLRDKLYAYDFEKIHAYLDNKYYGKRLIVGNEKILMQRFLMSMKQNGSFLSEAYVK